MDELLVKIARAMINVADETKPLTDDGKVLMHILGQAKYDHPDWTLEQMSIFARVQFMKFVLERYVPSFECPSCGGTHFGRDSRLSQSAIEILPTVKCHDEFGRGCKWHDVWPIPGTSAEEIVEGMK